MTQEEKQLLLKDLCARFPYGVALCAFYKTDEGWKEGDTRFLGMRVDEGYVELYLDNGWIAYLDDVKPYLRPMSSMTDEERNEAIQFEINNLGPIGCNWNLLVSNSSQLVDWLNKKMFDYRGLIEEGLALKAPDGMYKQ